MKYDQKYYKGIELFNTRKYFDAHEIWEDLWNEEHGEPHKFIQGLIQFATCLHHFESSNLKGARLLYHGGMELMEPYGTSYWNLNLKKLKDDMTACCKEMLPYQQSELPGRYHPDKKSFPVQLKEELIPKIQLEK